MVPLSTGMPSMIQRGSVPDEMELMPRILICWGAPGTPAPELTCTPVAMPCRADSTEVGTARMASSALTVLTEPM